MSGLDVSKLTKGLGRVLLFINGAVLLGCAVFDFSLFNITALSGFDIRSFLMMALMLLLPLADRHWSWPVYSTYYYQLPLRFGLAAVIILIVWLNSVHVSLILSTVFLIALPEEWFFRAYFMQRLESVLKGPWLANLSTSVFFAVLHVPTQGWFGLAVFAPSLIFGWLYQRQKDLVLVIMLHALSNVVFVSYLTR